MKKLLSLSVLALAALGLASCGGGSTPSSGNSASDNSSSTETIAPTLVGAYLSPSELGYANMRPSYNYYLTTFTQQYLEVYSDNTYKLAVSSSIFSALILPETGNEAQGNERDNYLTYYYGAYTTEEDDLDEDTVYYHLSEPSRIVSAYDAAYYFDTDNWTDTMKTKTADTTYEYDAETGQQTETGSVEYETGADYLAAKKYSAVKVTTSTSQASLTYVDLFDDERTADSSAPETKTTNLDTNIKSMYLSPAQLSYSNARPSYNIYVAKFAFQALTVFTDSSYNLTDMSMSFSALVLPETGNEIQGNERDNYLQNYSGTCTSSVDELDEDIVYYELSEPTRVYGAVDSSYYYDTDNWNDTMSENVGFTTGAECLSAKKFSATQATTAEATSALTYITLAATV